MKVKSKFYKTYFLVLSVFAVVLAVLLVLLGIWLGSYEKAQPETIVNELIENFVTKNNVYGINEVAPLGVSEYESGEKVNSFFAELTNGKNITASSSASRIDGADVAYTIKADEQKLLNVYFKKTEKSSSLLSTFEVISVAFEDEFYNPATITLPPESIVTINGKVLNNSNIKQLSAPNIPEKYMSAALSTNGYIEIPDLISKELEVTASLNGELLKVTKSGNEYTISDNIDEKTVNEISAFAIEASKTYSAYMQEDSSLTNIKKYFATDTDFYENLRTSLVMFSLDHEGFRFEDVVAHSVSKYSEKIYSCRVTLTQILIRNKQEYKDYYDKEVYIYIDDGKMSVIDLQTTGGGSDE